MRMTLEQAREDVHAKLDDGTHCPCCDQWAKRYTRTITSAMAYGLILLDKAAQRDGSEYVHVEKLFKSLSGIPTSIRGDISKLRHWDLIVRHPMNAGEYAITVEGVEFVHGRRTVLEYCNHYNNEVSKPFGREIRIREALGKRFDYDKIMGKAMEPTPA